MYLGARRRASQGARVWRGAWVPPLGQAAAVGVACWPRCRAGRFSKLHCGSGLSATMSGLEIQQTPLWEWPIGHDVGLGDSANSIVGVAYRPRCRAWRFSRESRPAGRSHRSGAQTKQRLNRWAQAVWWEWPIGHDAELGASRGDAAGRPSPPPAAAYDPPAPAPSAASGPRARQTSPSPAWFRADRQWSRRCECHPAGTYSPPASPP